MRTALAIYPPALVVDMITSAGNAVNCEPPCATLLALVSKLPRPRARHRPETSDIRRLSHMSVAPDDLLQSCSRSQSGEKPPHARSVR
jgi:hypothetical protein